MQRDVTTPEAYMQAIEGEQHDIVSMLWNLIKSEVPDAKEEVKSGVLYYDENGGLFAIAAQKQHVSLYVLASATVRAHEDELSQVNHGKGCLRFRKLNKIPVETIRRVFLTARSLDERDCS